VFHIGFIHFLDLLICEHSLHFLMRRLLGKGLEVLVELMIHRRILKLLTIARVRWKRLLIKLLLVIAVWVIGLKVSILVRVDLWVPHLGLCHKRLLRLLMRLLKLHDGGWLWPALLILIRGLQERLVSGIGFLERLVYVTRTDFKRLWQESDPIHFSQGFLEFFQVCELHKAISFGLPGDRVNHDFGR